MNGEKLIVLESAVTEGASSLALQIAMSLFEFLTNSTM